MMSVEQSVEWKLVGETEALWEKLSQCHFVHHKSHVTWRDMVWSGTPAAVVGVRRQTVWAMARPKFLTLLYGQTVYKSLHVERISE
jgi:hypothetical protein